MEQPDRTETLVRKLSRENRLKPEDITALKALPLSVEELAQGSMIAREGDRPKRCCLVIAGFLFRAKTTEDGKRQILSFHIPGDIPDLQSLHLHVSDHDLVALSRSTVAFIAHHALHDLTYDHPGIAAALWRETLVDAAMFRDWIVNVSRRPAAPRLAHLLSELVRRLKIVGLAEAPQLYVPLTQTDLADALGLTAVHVNRTLQMLRRKGMIEFRNQMLTIANIEALEELGAYDPLYLHADPSL